MLCYKNKEKDKNSLSSLSQNRTSIIEDMMKTT